MGPSQGASSPESVTDSARRWLSLSPRRETAFTAAVAAVVTAILYCAQLLVRGEFPFGRNSNQINDLPEQAVPFAAEFRRLLLGSTELSSFDWTWTLGLGVPFRGLYGTYLSNPAYAIVTLFPESQTELAMAVLVILHLALAAASMALLLRHLNSTGPIWALIVLSTGYALGGWAINDGNYLPFWLSGLVLLPVLILVGRWALEGKHFVAGSLLIATAWWSNFYTAFIISLGAFLIVLIMAVAERRPWRGAIIGFVRFGTQGVLGVALTSVILIPGFVQISRAMPESGAEPTNIGPHQLLGHLLPFTEGVSLSPSLFVGSAALILALALVGRRGLSRRLRLTYLCGLALLITSFGLGGTLWIWNGFDTPNGSLWRSALVGCALLVIMAWQTVSDLADVGWLGWVTAAVFLLVIAAATLFGGGARSFHPIAFGFVALTFVTLVLLARLGSMRTVLVASLCALVAVELSASAGYTIEARKLILGAQEMRMHEPCLPSEVAKRGPDQRVGLVDCGANMGALYNLPTPSYYSSLIPAQVTHTLFSRLGASAGNRIRIMLYAPDAVSDAILGVGARITAEDSVAVPAFKLVRSFSPQSHEADPPIPKVFANRQSLLPGPVYSAERSGALLPGKPDPRGRVAVPAGWTATLALSCPSGQHLAFEGKGFHGELDSNLGAADLNYQTWLSPAPSDGSPISLKLSADKPGSLPISAFACVDVAALTAMTNLDELAALQIEPGRIKAKFREPVQTALISTVRIPGWQCTAGSAPAQIGDIQGLMTVQMAGQTDLTCQYRTPNARTGLAVTLAAGLVLIAIGVVSQWRRRAASKGDDK